MANYAEPAYAIKDIIEKARVGFIRFRRDALDGAAELGFDYRDIIDCIVGLVEGDFHKSMDAQNPNWPGCRQDVYKPTYCGEELYVKVQYWPEKRLYVVSFKRK